MTARREKISAPEAVRSVRGTRAPLWVSGSVSAPEAERKLAGLLERYQPGSGTRAKVIFTNNSSTMASKSETAGRITLRLHALFQKAPANLLEDLVRYFLCEEDRGSKQIRSRLIDFVAEHREETLAEFPLHCMVPPRGQSYDLCAVRDQVVAEYFAELRTIPECLPRMGWTKLIQRSLMGKWIEHPPPRPNLILVNRLLDSIQVPHYYLEYVVYHELLHELNPIVRRDGRWIHHPPEFRERERRYPLFESARRWEERELARHYRRMRIQGR